MLTDNDHPVHELPLALVKVGVWVADVELDATDPVMGAVVLSDGQGNDFQGTVFRGGQQVGRAHARILGGTGGLHSVQLEARHYQAATARLVAEEAVSGAGEALDPATDPLAITLDYWSRAAGTAGAALSQLAEAVGCLWRVLPNGKVWLGQDSSEPVVLPQVLELDRNRAYGTIELGLDALVLHAGDVWGTERVSRILYRMGDEQPLRATVWPEAV
jgi:hypothetical protein